MAMTIQKFIDTETDMRADQWQYTKKMEEEFDKLKAQCSINMEAIQRIYDPLTDKWHPWCTANLLPAEMNLRKNLYTRIKAIFDLIV